jgi:hypothetical protein
MMKGYFYVIAPVGADPAFEEKKIILVDLGVGNGMKPWFPLDHHSGLTPAEAVRDMLGAEFVIADLSRERPSCYYELGLADASGADVTLMAETGTRIHQVRDPDKLKFYGDLGVYRRIVGEILANRRRMPVG